MIMTTIHYRKLQDWRPKRLYCHFRLSVVVTIARGQFPGSVSSRWVLSKTPYLPLELSFYLSLFQTYNYFRFRGHISIFGCRSLSQSLGPRRHFIRARHGRKSRTCRWNFDAICFSCGGITISVIFSYRSMLQSLVDTFCELAVVENSKFCRRKCNDICHAVILPTCVHNPHCYFRLSVNVAFICGHFL